MQDPIPVGPPLSGPSVRPAPRLPGSVAARASADEVIDDVAADLFMQAKSCVRTFGDYHLAVAVGPQTEPLLRRLMYDPQMRDLPWKRTHLWMVEEAAGSEVEAGAGPRAAALRELVVEPSDIPAEQVHVIRVESADAAGEYEHELRETLGWREKGHDRLDTVLLGLDESGGVGAPGLFAGAGGELAACGSGVIGLTASFVNAARFVAVLAMGRGVASGLRAVEAWSQGAGVGPGRPGAMALRPLAGELRWYVEWGGEASA